MEQDIIKLLNDNIYEINKYNIDSETKLISSGLIDSFDILNIVYLLEENFKIKINIENIELKDFNTVKSILEMVKKNAK